MHLLCFGTLSDLFLFVGFLLGNSLSLLSFLHPLESLLPCRALHLLSLVTLSAYPALVLVPIHLPQSLRL